MRAGSWSVLSTILHPVLGTQWTLKDYLINKSTDPGDFKVQRECINFGSLDLAPCDLE